jgi:sigma-B regulation protein RsbU (phosphoserine phosphatase)
MAYARRPWQEELEIIDRTMRKISGITDPDDLVDAYWNGIGSLIPVNDYAAVSRRNVEPPCYILTRSSRFKEQLNPFTQRERLPRLSGGVLGEVAYANRPIIIDDLPARLAPDDPAHFYLEGFQSLIALPQYDGGEGLNVTAMLVRPGHEFDRAIIPILHWQAGLFGRGTTNVVLRNQLSATLATLDRELQVVGQIQRSLLPRELPGIPGFELAADYVTSAQAGGDYYDFFPLPGGAWGLLIADVSGHGTPAAVLMAITHALAHAQPGAHTDPATLLRSLNTQLVRRYTRGSGTFVTAFYAVLDPTKRTLTYSLAGHNPPRVARGERIVPLDENSGLPLGIDLEQTYGNTTIQLERGDLLLLYTDGIVEAPGPARGASPRQLFSIGRLDAVARGCGDVSGPQHCINRIRRELEAFCRTTSAADDQTLVAIRCL